MPKDEAGLLPLPSAGGPLRIDKFKMVNNQIGWAIGGIGDDLGHILRTVDGGRTWEVVSPPQKLPERYADLLDVTGYFQDADNAWAVYYNTIYKGPGQVWRTRDAGRSWDLSWGWIGSVFGQIPNGIHIQFLDHKHGWLIIDSYLGAGSTESELFRSIDGGLTWTLSYDDRIPWGTSWLLVPLYGLDFFDPNHGLATGSKHMLAGQYVYWTDDGGLSWRAMELPPPPMTGNPFRTRYCRTVNPSVLAPGSVLVVVACDGRTGQPNANFLYASADNGQSWDIQPIPGDFVVNAAVVLSRQLLYAVGQPWPSTQEAAQAILLRTRIGGMTWEEVSMLDASSKVQFLDETTGWAVVDTGNGSGLRHTTDGGQTWAEISPVLTLPRIRSELGLAPPAPILPNELLPLNPDSVSALEPLTFLPIKGPTVVRFSTSGNALYIAQENGQVLQVGLDEKTPSLALMRHSDWVYDLAYTPVYVQLASASRDGSLQALDLTGLSRYRRVTKTGEVTSVVYSPDGEILASGFQDGTLRLWDVYESLAERSILSGHTGWVWDVDFSPDGALLASASADRSVRLWDTENGRVLKVLLGHRGLVGAVAFSPIGGTLASASWDGTVIVWDIITGEGLHTLVGHDDWVYTVTFNPEGTLIASGAADGTVRFWDPEAGNLLYKLGVGPGVVRDLAISADNRVLAVAMDTGLVALWGILP